MSIGSDYPHPVNVNGYSCRNCTDVDYAKKHIDPAHPKSGPYDVDAQSDPTRKAAFVLDGKLSAAQVSSITPADPSASGQRLNVTA
ncbi:MAG: hypothetical protein JF571_10625 [Asticcacaulis sp.]|nr:hypothetical protein [Asticcacaulis sp.]